MSKEHLIKKIGFTVFCLFLSFYLQRNVTANEIIDFYKQIDKITSEKDIGKALDLLNTLDNKEICSFNGTLGPITNFSLQLTIIEVLAHYNLINNVSSNSDSIWLKLVNADPENTQEILKILNSKNPAIRWLGLYKLTQVEFEKIDQSIIEKVTSIAQNDKYVIITRIPIQSKGGSQISVGNTKNDFKAPIQEMAFTFLEKNGISISTDETKMYENGINYLKTLYNEHRKRLLLTIYFLAKDSQARKVIQDQLKKSTLPQDKKVLEDFMWALENNIYSGKIMREQEKEKSD